RPSGTPSNLEGEFPFLPFLPFLALSCPFLPFLALSCPSTVDKKKPGKFAELLFYSTVCL
ncbi:MAG: hypothetical protein IKU97_04020, partial [Tidjanibacter sp.]|nr:hypothetical protein [Tidjanibacter sp.]